MSDEKSDDIFEQPYINSSKPTIWTYVVPFVLMTLGILIGTYIGFLIGEFIF
jgi:hypothetical protein